MSKAPSAVFFSQVTSPIYTLPHSHLKLHILDQWWLGFPMEGSHTLFTGLQEQQAGEHIRVSQEVWVQQCLGRN
jgi:hypothetical protein